MTRKENAPWVQVGSSEKRKFDRMVAKWRKKGYDVSKEWEKYGCYFAVLVLKGQDCPK